MKPKPKRGNFEVRMVCTVEKIVKCHNCTAEEVRKDPFEHAVDEREVHQIDWNVSSVREIE